MFLNVRAIIEKQYNIPNANKEALELQKQWDQAHPDITITKPTPTSREIVTETGTNADNNKTTNKRSNSAQTGPSTVQTTVHKMYQT